VRTFFYVHFHSNLVTHIFIVLHILAAVQCQQKFFPRSTRKLFIGYPSVCNFSIRKTHLHKLYFLEPLGHCICSEAIMTPLLRPLYIGTIRGTKKNRLFLLASSLYTLASLEYIKVA